MVWHSVSFCNEWFVFTMNERSGKYHIFAYKQRIPIQSGKSTKKMENHIKNSNSALYLDSVFSSSACSSCSCRVVEQVNIHKYVGCRLLLSTFLRLRRHFRLDAWKRKWVLTCSDSCQYHFHWEHVQNNQWFSFKAHSHYHHWHTITIMANLTSSPCLLADWTK